MSGSYYKSVPDELQAAAFACEAWLKQNGYIVHREVSNIEHPALATMTCKRTGDTLYVLVRSNLDVSELATWVRYGRSCTKATAITVCIPSKAQTTGAKIAEARSMMGGIIVVAPDRSVQEIIEPGDLSFSPSLPELAKVRSPIKRLIAPSHQAFQSGNWKKGFEDACKVAENCSRDYLLRQQKLGRAEVLDGSTLRQLTRKDIMKMTLGGLANAFCRLKAQNATEAFLCSALKRINPERIITTHKGKTVRDREQLKRAVGRHMWVIQNILEQVV